MDDRQRDLFDDDNGASEQDSSTRALLDRLIGESRLYKQSKDYKELLEFVVRLRNFAPFNAMLLQVQKPGLRFAASAVDWKHRFARSPKLGARPLLIMWPFGPVALVYDVMDTEGPDLPKDVETFPAAGSISDGQLADFERRLRGKRIDLAWVDSGDSAAGSIRIVARAQSEKEPNHCLIAVNRNHSAATKFVTITHELAHLFLGHLGPDKKREIRDRARPCHSMAELEAESVAYLVCMRSGVRPKSQTYLSAFVDEKLKVDDLDIYQIMMAAGKVESILGLALRVRMEDEKRRK